jgi:hypothetical protein
MQRKTASILGINAGMAGNRNDFNEQFEAMLRYIATSADLKPGNDGHDGGIASVSLTSHPPFFLEVIFIHTSALPNFCADLLMILYVATEELLVGLVPLQVCSSHPSLILQCLRKVGLPVLRAALASGPPATSTTYHICHWPLKVLANFSELCRTILPLQLMTKDANDEEGEQEEEGEEEGGD